MLWHASDQAQSKKGRLCFKCFSFNFFLLLMLARVLALGCRNCESHHLFLPLRKCLKIPFFFVWSVLKVLRLQGALPNLPEMISDEEAQRTARKSALIVARMKDGSFRWGFYFVWKSWQLPRELGRMQVKTLLKTFRAEVLANMDDAGSAYTSKDMFAGSKADVDFVQVRAWWRITIGSSLFWSYSIHLFYFVRRCWLQ